MNEPSTRMNAGVLHGPGDLRYETVDRPTAGDDEALVRIRVNGICGSDIHFFESGRLGPFVVEKPYIPGHEAVGEVVELGNRTSGEGAGHPLVDGSGAVLAVGQRVVVEPGVPCRRCEYCKRGLYNLCQDVVFLSAPPVNGTFGEYLAHSADFLFAVPDSITDEEAALVEPVSVGVHACNRANLSPGASVAIVGAGPIGLITLLVAKAYGAGRCVMIDIDENRLNVAKELGAEATVRVSGDSKTVADAIETVGRRGADYVFDASGSSAGCSTAVRLAAPAGIVTLIGWPEKPSFDFPVEIVIERELDVRGINRYRNTYPTAIALMLAGKIDVKPLISHRFAFEDLVAAFEFASSHRNETIKVLVVNQRYASSLR